MTVTVEEVALPEERGAALAGAALETPAVGAVVEGFGLEIAGWAVGHSSAIDVIEILHGGFVVRATAPGLARRDISLRYPRRPGSDRAGFRTFVNLVGLPFRPRFELWAALDDGARAPVGEIAVRRTRICSPYEPSIDPLILTTTARTGSVWLAVLLGEHPEIVTYRPFESEPRVGAYWVHALRGLTDPGSYLQAIAPTTVAGNWWVADSRVDAFPKIPDRELDVWMRTESLEAIVGFCQQRIDAFYQTVARLEGKPSARFFSEKYGPTFVPTALAELYPRAREVFLVRDPRDQVASMLAWNKRAGRELFALGAGSLEDAIKRHSRHTRAVLRHWKSRQEQSLLIRYEDVIRQPAPTLARVFEHAGIDASAATIRDVIGKASAAAPGLQKSHRTAPSPKASLGRWRRDIDASLWPLLEETFADELTAWYADGNESAGE